jgi:hypothetical protein
MFQIVSAVTQTTCGLALSCSNKTPILSSPRRFNLKAFLRWFLRRSQCKELVTRAHLDVCCSTSGLWWSQIASAPLSPQMSVCGTFGFWWGGMAPSSFLAPSDEHSFHLHSLCASGSRHFLLRIVSKIPGRRPCVFTSVRGVARLGTHLVDILWNCNTSWVTWWAELLSNSQHRGNFVHLNATVFLNGGLSLHYYLQGMVLAR